MQAQNENELWPPLEMYWILLKCSWLVKKHELCWSFIDYGFSFPLMDIFSYFFYKMNTWYGLLLLATHEILAHINASFQSRWWWKSIFHHRKIANHPNCDLKIILIAIGCIFQPDLKTIPRLFSHGPHDFEIDPEEFFRSLARLNSSQQDVELGIKQCALPPRAVFIRHR